APRAFDMTDLPLPSSGCPRANLRGVEAHNPATDAMVRQLVSRDTVAHPGHAHLEVRGHVFRGPHPAISCFAPSSQDGTALAIRRYGRRVVLRVAGAGCNRESVPDDFKRVHT